jgi:hypothetical protein
MLARKKRPAAHVHDCNRFNQVESKAQLKHPIVECLVSPIVLSAKSKNRISAFNDCEPWPC